MLTAPSILLVALMIAIHLGIAFLVANEVRYPDVVRFDQIAQMDGRPYRDVPVEYAPVELVGIETFYAGSVARGTATMVWFAVGCSAAVVGGLWYGWGRPSAMAYLILSLPAATFLYLGFDLLAIALATLAMACVRRDRESVGGMLLALAVGAKIWPLVLVPLLVVERRWRALAWFAAALVIVVGAWVAYGGPDAVRQVLTFRGATGWDVQSTVGLVLWVAGLGVVRIQQGAPRLGAIPGWARMISTLGLLATSVVIWWRARTWSGPIAGAPALAAVCALLVFSPTSSIQYTGWLLPWAAICARETGTRWASWMVMAIAAAMFSITTSIGRHVGLAQVILVVRTLMVISIPVLWLLQARSSAEHAAETQNVTLAG